MMWLSEEAKCIASRLFYLKYISFMNSTRTEMISILSISNGLTVSFVAAAYMTLDLSPFQSRRCSKNNSIEFVINIFLRGIFCFWFFYRIFFTVWFEAAAAYMTPDPGPFRSKNSSTATATQNWIKFRAQLI